MVVINVIHAFHCQMVKSGINECEWAIIITVGITAIRIDKANL